MLLLFTIEICQKIVILYITALYFLTKVELMLTSCVCAEQLQLCPILCDLWTIAHQVPLFMGFSRQEYWSGLPYPPPGDLPDSGIEPTSLTSPASAGWFFTTSTIWEAQTNTNYKTLKLLLSLVSLSGQNYSSMIIFSSV